MRQNAGGYSSLAHHAWRAWVYPGVLVVLGLGFALVPLVRGEIFFYWDNAQYHYPQDLFLHQALRAGAIPHWSGMGAGTPIVAEGHVAHYHPIRLLCALLFSPAVAFMVEIGIYIAGAGLLTYAFLREFRVHRAACFVGGLCQMFGSFSIVSINNMSLHRSFWLLPLAMLMAERLTHRWKLSYGLTISFVVGLQLLSGYPIFALITMVAMFVYILCRLLQRAWAVRETFRLTVRRLGDVLTQWGIFVVFGFAIAAIQFLPTFLHVKQSIRQGGLRFEYAVSGLPAKIRYLLQLFFPYVYTQGEWLPTPTAWGSDFNEVAYAGIYVGTLPILLALLGLWWKPKWPHPGWPLAVCSIMATVLALGATTPLYPALWSIPVFSGMRYPCRFLMWTSFCLACLTALGLNRLLARSRLAHMPRRGAGRLTRMDWAPFLLLGGWMLLLAGVFWTQRATLARVIHMAPDVHVGILLSLVLFALACALAWGVLMMPRRYQGLLLITVMLFVFVDLSFFRTRSNYALTVPIQEVMAPPPVVAFVQRDHDQFRVMPLISNVKNMLLRNEDTWEFLLPNVSISWGIESAGLRGSLLLKRYYAIHESIIWEITNSPAAAEQLAGFLGFLNVKYVVAPQSITLQGWEKVHQTTRGATWKNPAFLPRAFLVGSIVPENIEVRDEWWRKATYERLERYHAMVSEGGWETRMEEAQIIDNIIAHPIHYRTTAVVAGNYIPELSGPDPEARVRMLPQEVDVMRFEVHTAKPALLVISNNDYPGWSATVNGQPAQIHRTNYVGMGVFVPAGHSAVVLRFVTPGFRFGAVVSCLSIALSFGGLLAARRWTSFWDIIPKNFFRGKTLSLPT